VKILACSLIIFFNFLLIPEDLEDLAKNLRINDEYQTQLATNTKPAAVSEVINQ